MKRPSSCILSLSALVSLGLALPATARSATFTVNSSADAGDRAPGDGLCQAASGECTLRAAIMETNALAGADVIDVPAGIYQLTIPSGNPDPWYFDTDAAVSDLDVKDNLTVRGAGASSTIIDASGLGDRILEVLGNPYTPGSLAVEIAGLTLRGGTTTLDGGCIRHYDEGLLTLRDAVLTGCKAATWSGGGLFQWGRGARILLIDSAVRDNAASWGGGIGGGNGTIELLRTSVTGNTALGPWGPAAGGGIYVPPGTLRATDSVISGNVAGRHGGGIYASQSDVTLVRTTVSGNEARNLTGQVGPGLGCGGGLYLERVRLALVNSTISGNQAEEDGAGVYGQRDVAFDISFSTIADNRNASNTGAAGLQMLAPEPFVPWYQRVQATVFAGNASGGGTVNCRFTKQVSNCDTWPCTVTESPLPPASGGFSVDEDGSCGLTASTDISSLPAGLGPLAANGGLGATHELLPGSPALDQVPPADCFFWVDDDLDYRVNEDPVDGLDNDGDWRVDEDPAVPVATDQRGVVRPYGTGCDVGSFEVDPAGQLATIRAQIEALVEGGVLNGGQGHALLGKLDRAAEALAAGDTAAAIRHLETFVNQVEAFENARILTATEAQSLLDAARRLIAELGG